jgi:hypothetical protein
MPARRRPFEDDGAPPLEGPDPDAPWSAPREIALRRLARAEAPGMTCREDTREILERGRDL